MNVYIYVNMRRLPGAATAAAWGCLTRRFDGASFWTNSDLLYS